MDRISEYRKNATQCLKLAESSNENDRRALVQMAADWRALADKASQREASRNLRRLLLHGQYARSLRFHRCDQSDS